MANENDTDKASKALKRADRLMTAFRQATNTSIPLQLAQTFVLAAQNEGTGVVELADKAGASKGTMSRHLLDLSERLRSGDEGYGLLQRSNDPTNLRLVIYTLTPKGRLLKNQIVDILED